MTLAAAAVPVLPHLAPDECSSLLAGLAHAFTGLDHVLTIIAVGLWGAVLGGRALWAPPSAFVGSMVAGFALLLAGAELVWAEPLILASVPILGFAVAMMLRPPLWVAAAATGAFGFFHGQAHGAELGSAGAWAFGSGFLVSTALLHLAGLVIALGFAQGLHQAWLIRALGGAVALGGLWMAYEG